jgi:hypothetical protein
MIQGSKRTSKRSTFITTAFDMQAMLDSRKRFQASSASSRPGGQDGRPPSNDSSTNDKEESPEPKSNGFTEEKDEMEQLEEEIRKSQEELKLDMHLDGLDINQLAVDGKMMSTVLDEVLLKFGLESKVETKSEKKGKKTKEELKISIQNHIIIQLGKRMEKMQSVIDDLNGKLATAANDQKRVKSDRDDVRRRLIFIQKDLKEKSQQLKDAQSKSSGRAVDDELISVIIADIKKKSGVAGIREEMSLIREVAEDASSARNSDVSTVKKRTSGVPEGMSLIHEDAELGSDVSQEREHNLERNPSLGKKEGSLPAISGQERHIADTSTEQNDEAGSLRNHKKTLLEIRHRVDLLEARKRFEPPTRLGAALRTLVTDDDVAL